MPCFKRLLSLLQDLDELRDELDDEVSLGENWVQVESEVRATRRSRPSTRACPWWRSDREIGWSKSGGEKRRVDLSQTFAVGLASWSTRESHTHTNSDISPHWRTASQGNVRIHALLRLCHKTPWAIAASPRGFRCRRRIDSDFIDSSTVVDGDTDEGNSASAQFPHTNPQSGRD